MLDDCTEEVETSADLLFAQPDRSFNTLDTPFKSKVVTALAKDALPLPRPVIPRYFDLRPVVSHNIGVTFARSHTDILENSAAEFDENSDMPHHHQATLSTEFMHAHGFNSKSCTNNDLSASRELSNSFQSGKNSYYLSSSSSPHAADSALYSVLCFFTQSF